MVPETRKQQDSILTSMHHVLNSANSFTALSGDSDVHSLAKAMLCLKLLVWCDLRLWRDFVQRFSIEVGELDIEHGGQHHEESTQPPRHPEHMLQHRGGATQSSHKAHMQSVALHMDMMMRQGRGTTSLNEILAYYAYFYTLLLPCLGEQYSMLQAIQPCFCYRSTRYQLLMFGQRMTRHFRMLVLLSSRVSI